MLFDGLDFDIADSYFKKASNATGEERPEMALSLAFSNRIDKSSSLIAVCGIWSFWFEFWGNK